jgi:methionyl-tRNA formyltransferase
MHMRIVFMGTPDFAVTSLQFLLESKHEIVYVVSAPDKLGGRGGNQLLESDVKRFSLENGLDLLQPLKLKDPDFLGKLRKANADVFVVVAFRMLPEEVWCIPPAGTINIHGSLLPAYRGAAPINWALINGEKSSGVTSFLINKSIDTGSILLQKETPISPDENAGELYERLKQLGAQLLIDTLEGMESGQLLPIAQDESKVSHAPKLNRENCKLNVLVSALDMHNQIRGLSPFPGAWLETSLGEFKFFKTRRTDITVDSKDVRICYIEHKKVWLNCKDLRLEVELLQMQGKRRMTAAEFVNGWKGSTVIL